MIRLTMAGNAKLYHGAETALRQVKAAAHKFIFLSNGKHSYVQARREQFVLEQYFSAIYRTEDFNFAPK